MKNHLSFSMNTVVQRMEMMVIDLMQFCHGKKHMLNIFFTSVSKGCKAIIFGIITASYRSLLILNTEDFGISNANAIDMMVLL